MSPIMADDVHSGEYPRVPKISVTNEPTVSSPSVDTIYKK